MNRSPTSPVATERDWVQSVPAVDATSPALERLNDFYRRVSAMGANPGVTLDQLRREFEHWGDVGAEPNGVDYLHTSLASVPSLQVRPRGACQDRVLLCLHGGAYSCGSFFSHRKMYAHLAARTGCVVEILGYRRVPEASYPASAIDAYESYQYLLDKRQIAPEHIGLVGDSAGAALCVAALLLARAHALPMPAAIAPLSPWVDLEAQNSVFDTNDRDLIATREQVRISTEGFIGNGDRRDPLAAPIYADFTGFPPIYMQAGGAENFAADAEIMGVRALEFGVHVRLDIFQEMQHVFQMAAGAAPEADEAIERLANFFRDHLELDRAKSATPESVSP